MSEAIAAPSARPRPRAQRALGLLGAILVAVAALSACLGAVPISPGQLLDLWLAPLGIASPWPHEPLHEAIFWSIRLPRIALGVLVGGALALSGAALQGLFRNPLADPALIGVSSGGAASAALILVLAPAGLMAWMGDARHLALPLAAFAGGLGAALLVYRLATRAGRTSVATMLLAGIAVNALCGALIGLLSYVSNDAALRALTLWSLGSLGGASWPVVLAALPCVALAVVGLLAQARTLNAALLGDAEALHMGHDLARLRWRCVGLSALAVGACVGFTGVVGFVGLVAPHLVRLLCGPDHRVLLPGAALLGAALLLAADLLCRVAVAPAELPLGVVTALLGAPFFLWLMSRRLREEAW